MARTGIVGKEIKLQIKFYENGSLFDPYNVQDVKIYSVATGGTTIAALPVVRLSLGYYEAVYDIPLTLAAGTYYDEWTWTAESGMLSKTQRYSFDLTTEGASAGAGTPEPAIAIAGCRSRPHWIHLPGLQLVEDVGNGTGLRLSWMEAAPSDTDKQVHYNIYRGDTKYEVLDALESLPLAITTARQIVINNNDPGNLQYFIVTPTEFDPANLNITEMVQIGADVYQYPLAQTLQADIDAYGATIEVEDNSEFPEKGFLKIGYEVIQYSHKDNTTKFFVEDTERGAFTTFPEAHSAGDTVVLFKGVEEQNTIIFEETATWQPEYGIPRDTSAIGEFNVDEDGYRTAAEDLITTDLSLADAENVDFTSYDYCGYHRPSLQETFGGNACLHSYAGGEYAGSRGFNLQDRNLARLDSMLQVTGEPVVLLRRKTSGRRCRCMQNRREQPRFRCAYCYGTRFDGGYDRYVNPRAISESWPNSQGWIMARIAPFSDDLKLEQSQGLVQPDELTAWTISVPILKDRDIIIRLIRQLDGTFAYEEFRYEVLDVTRNTTVLGQSGQQQFRMRRQDKTDPIYQYNAII